MLSVIAKGFFADSPLLFFPVLALVIFLITFTFIAIRTLRSSDESIQHVAGLPLGDDTFDMTSEKAHDNE